MSTVEQSSTGSDALSFDTLQKTEISAGPNTLDRSEVKRLAEALKLLSDDVRLGVIILLKKNKEMHVTALCDAIGMTQPAVSHHIALLRTGGMIEARRDGKHNFYSIKRQGEEFFADIANLLSPAYEDADTPANSETVE